MTACGLAAAGDSEADLSIAASVAPDGILPPGTEGIATIRITNNGPDIETPRFVLRRTDNGTGFNDYPPLIFTGPVSGPCIGDPRFDPPPGDIFFLWLIPDLGAGESRV